jgi:hypothetical protein
MHSHFSHWTTNCNVQVDRSSDAGYISLASRTPRKAARRRTPSIENNGCGSLLPSYRDISSQQATCALSLESGDGLLRQHRGLETAQSP